MQPQKPGHWIRPPGAYGTATARQAEGLAESGGVEPERETPPTAIYKIAAPPRRGPPSRFESSGWHQVKVKMVAMMTAFAYSAAAAILRCSRNADLSAGLSQSTIAVALSAISESEYLTI